MFEDQLKPDAFDIATVAGLTGHMGITVEARQVRLSDNPVSAPKGPNAWRYIRDESKECVSGVINVNFGPIINVSRGQTLKLKWTNELGSMPAMSAKHGPTLIMPPINPLPMQFKNDQWMAMNPSVGIVTHLHGAVVAADSDGWPLAPISFSGNPYGFPTTREYVYTNDQRATMLWFHDHAMDNTSIQVHSGLAGVYFVRDKSDDEIFSLIGHVNESEIPLVIQDRVVDRRFAHINYWAGVPTITDSETLQQDFDRSEYLGETVFVNGRPWPTHCLQQRVYRLRILNGSNARTYALALVNPSAWATVDATASPQVWHSDKLTIIGNDGGLLAKSVTLVSTDYLLIAPAERLDVLLDLTGVDPKVTPQLRLVNLAVASITNRDWPEAIFQTSEAIQIPPFASSIVESIDPSNDRGLLAILSGTGPANILEFCIVGTKSEAPVNSVAVDTILGRYATGDGFRWNGNTLDTDPPNSPIASNRFILLMNNSESKSGASLFAQGDWRDTQIWELSSTPGLFAAFQVPFDVDLTHAQPATGSPSAPKPYYVSRSAFFDFYPASKRIDATPFGYAPLNTNVIQPKAGSYERWYIANIGNWQPGDAQPVAGIPDMHPFHMHLVNFVVLNRWRLDASSNQFTIPSYLPRRLDFDGVARHDTVRVQSNELLELLVYFPPGYRGLYPYHCHIVEHEDMGMMSHFEVI